MGIEFETISTIEKPNRYDIGGYRTRIEIDIKPINEQKKRLDFDTRCCFWTSKKYVRVSALKVHGDVRGLRVKRARYDMTEIDISTYRKFRYNT